MGVLSSRRAEFITEPLDKHGEWRAATSAILTATLSRSDRASRSSSTVDARVEWDGAFAAAPCPVRFDFDSADFPGEPVAIATPRPILGIFYEAAFDGVAMDVAKFLGELGLAEDVEIEVANLPELRAVAFEGC